MTLSPSAVARARRPDSICVARRAATAGLLPALAALSLFATGPIYAETYAGVGVASFSGPDSFDRRSRGLSLHAGWRWRPVLAIEAGVIDQRGDVDLSSIDLPRDLVQHRWRALHAGLRWFLPLGERWHASAGLAAAHVAVEREDVVVTTYFEPGSNLYETHYSTRRSPTRSSWGWIGRIGLGFDLTPAQRLSLDYQRLHAGLKQHCRFDAGYPDCDHTRSTSIDGVQLAWSFVFR